jgi:hypothetical protein
MHMADRRNVIAEQLRDLADDLKGLGQAATRDPKEQVRKERAWQILFGVTSAVFAIAGRQVATRIWGTLTGERPPGKR